MLTGEKVRLWALEREDLIKFYIWTNDPNVVYLAGLHPLPKSFAEINLWHDAAFRNPMQRTFAIKTGDGNHIGMVEVVDIDLRIRRCEIGVFIGDGNYIDKGFGHDAVDVILNFIFKQLNINKVAVRVLEYNTKAKEFFKKIGFKEEGVLRQDYFSDGKYYNIHVMGLLAEEWKK